MVGGGLGWLGTQMSGIGLFRDHWSIAFKGANYSF